MRIAVVGAGVSGLGAAWALRHAHDVTILERDERLGGHANTRDVPDGSRTLAVDTGFIVHNRRTYPELIALFEELDVPTQETEMSLSVECTECGIQYAGRRPWSLVVGVLRRPRLLPLLVQIRRALRHAAADLERGVDPDLTLAEWARSRGCSDHLLSHFLMPLTAAVWSAPPGEALQMPAAYILGFLDNHGMLSMSRLQWRTIPGGSRVYVNAMRAALERDGVTIRCSAGVSTVDRSPDAVTITLDDGTSETFDAVVLATHADHSLAMLTEPTPLEQQLLGAWTYTPNSALLHDDERMLPSQRSARAGWNYRIDTCAGDGAHPKITYFMNRLQRLPASRPWSVSLNAVDQVRPDRVVYATDYRHPRFDADAVRTQARLHELDEQVWTTRTAFCGAWRGFGFHEDGLRSGLVAARALLEDSREVGLTT